MPSIRKPMAPGAVSLALMPVVFAVFILGTAANALAHRVNIFAWTEGNEVVAECGFNGGNKVKQGQIAVYDAATGAKLLEGKTDDEGGFRFPIPFEETVGAYFKPEHKAINLMRWIRKQLEENESQRSGQASK